MRKQRHTSSCCSTCWSIFCTVFSTTESLRVSRQGLLYTTTHSSSSYPFSMLPKVASDRAYHYDAHDNPSHYLYTALACGGTRSANDVSETENPLAPRKPRKQKGRQPLPYLALIRRSINSQKVSLQSQEEFGSKYLRPDLDKPVQQLLTIKPDLKNRSFRHVCVQVRLLLLQ